PVEPDDLRVEALTVMEFHPLAEGYFQGTLVEPLPAGCQARHQLAILVEFDEVFEDVQANPDPIEGGLIHNAQFPPWRGGLFSNAAGAPPEKAEDEASNAKLVHGRPSTFLQVKAP